VIKEKRTLAHVSTMQALGSENLLKKKRDLLLGLGPESHCLHNSFFLKKKKAPLEWKLQDESGENPLDRTVARFARQKKKNRIVSHQRKQRECLLVGSTRRLRVKSPT